MSSLLRQLEEFTAAMRVIGARYALIGGLAMSAHQLPRATQDIDFLLDNRDADAVHTWLISEGFECIHRSPDAANYRRGNAAIDFIYAFRARALALIESSQIRHVGSQELRVVTVEGIIGLKFQVLTNDPSRAQDLLDIRALIQAHRSTLKLPELHDYFLLFDKEALYDELIKSNR
jgi:hypothetical protein